MPVEVDAAAASSPEFSSAISMSLSPLGALPFLFLLSSPLNGLATKQDVIVIISSCECQYSKCKGCQPCSIVCKHRYIPALNAARRASTFSCCVARAFSAAACSSLHLRTRRLPSSSLSLISCRSVSFSVSSSSVPDLYRNRKKAELPYKVMHLCSMTDADENSCLCVYNYVMPTCKFPVVVGTKLLQHSVNFVAHCSRC